MWTFDELEHVIAHYPDLIIQLVATFRGLVNMQAAGENNTGQTGENQNDPQAFEKVEEPVPKEKSLNLKDSEVDMEIFL